MTTKKFVDVADKSNVADKSREKNREGRDVALVGVKVTFVSRDNSVLPLKALQLAL